MIFLNREAESARLLAAGRRREGGLVVLYGRRRVGKTRLLLEWVREAGGVYFVADQSPPATQRRYLAQVLAARLPGFADVQYDGWRQLFSRLAADAKASKFRGPIVLDELPYLVAASPELPSVLQQWVDHEGREARLTLAVSGSSQRMMQGLVLGPEAPLFGRAHALLDLKPLTPPWLAAAFPKASGFQLVTGWAAWGGVPRYWELALDEPGDLEHRVEHLVLDPLGPLHREPDRLLLEELPPAPELRPLLEAIGAGAHRLSEVAARVGRPATSLSRALDRLQGMGLVGREVPFAEDPKAAKRSLYRLADPFLRLWFRLVAPHRGLLATQTSSERRALLAKHLPALAAEAWEEVCRDRLPALSSRCSLAALGAWTAASRWWQGAAPEWDLVSQSADGRRLLLGEARALRGPISRRALETEARRLRERPAPPLGSRFAKHEVVRALFVPEATVRGPIDGVHLVTAEHVFEPPTRRS
jgi:AAA+ ATPase superfamily predicted ATPase